MPARDEDMLTRRLIIVESHIDEGTGLTDAAKEIGISPPGLSQYLDNAGYRDLRKQLGSRTRIAQDFPIEKHIERVQAVVQHGNQAGACRALGLKAPALSKWLKDNGYGPDYAADLEDLLDDGANG